MNNSEITSWLEAHFKVDSATIIEALKLSPSAQGYIHGAVSEILLNQYLESEGYEVQRIKEKPAGGFDEKKKGYKGDFLIKDKQTNLYYVVECKGLKTNSEFRGAKTDDETYVKQLTKKQAFNVLKKYYNPDKNKTYQTGLRDYNRQKEAWEAKNPNKTFPAFRWNIETAGADNADITNYFNSIQELKDFVDNCDENLLSEVAFRNHAGLYKILQTHEPSSRIDEETGIDQAAPIVSDFSMMAVDLFQRIGEHKFVFMNPDKISHSPTSPNHLYQNYIIDIIIPGKKDNLEIKHPWYSSIKDCISNTQPRTVEYDETQIDHR